MDTVNKLLTIQSRLDHLENSAEWLARESVHLDNTITQTSTLISVLADEIRESIFMLVKNLEQDLKKAKEESGYH